MAMQGPLTRRYFKEMRFQQLRALVVVGRCRSFAAAAKELGLATPSVWQQIKGLEAEFDVELLRVREKQVWLTEAGAALVELAGPLIADFDGLHDCFEARLDKLPKRLVLAATSQLLRHELRGPIAQFRKTCNDVQLSIIDGPSSVARR